MLFFGVRPTAITGGRLKRKKEIIKSVKSWQGGKKLTIHSIFTLTSVTVSKV